MALDPKLRKQLVAARENITTQLMQLEGSTLDPFSLGGSPDYRDVYAELQKERREIDALLGSGARDDGREPYQPMATFAADRAQGMWRFRGVGAGNIALWLIAAVAWFAMGTDRIGLLRSAGCSAAVSVVSVWIAARTRERELQLFLFTIGIGTALIGIAALAVALTV